MPQNVFKFKYLSRIFFLIISLYSLDFISPLAAHAMEKNENKSEQKSKKIIIKFTTYTPNYKLPTSSSKEKNIKSKNENSNNNLCVLDKNDSEKNVIACLPLEILSEILFDFDTVTLIKADIVCRSFKKAGDLIWENKLLDLSRRLETPGRKGFNRTKTFVALEKGRYKNISLQHCELGDMDESFSLENCKVVDLSHNYIRSIDSFYFSGSLMNLQEFNLSHNMLSDKALNDLRKTCKNPKLRLILEPQNKSKKIG